jgi:hypothetical protein
MRQCESAFLHVRRQDYEHKLSASYYRAALKRLFEVVREPAIFLFGDDPDWARRELPLPSDAEFVLHNMDRNHEDLWLMMQCRHAIIANSSFSWWGAWLRQHTGYVIAPAAWGYRAAPASGWLTVQADLCGVPEAR